MNRFEADAKIPMLDLAAQHAALEEELLEGLSAVVSSGRFILGHPVETFEEELARRCDGAFALGCHSGTDALWLALKALGIGPGDAVLCPAYSFVATAASIARAGATPVFCDIDPATLNLDPEDALARLAQMPSIRAIIAVDLFGRACDLGPLEEACQKRGLALIHDAAQSLGARDAQGRAVGAAADVRCFSFYPTKNLGALGDAGAIVTDRSDLRARMRMLAVHGESERGVYTELGINSRLDALQAVALSVKLRHLDQWIAQRQRLAHHYDLLFLEHAKAGLPLEAPLPAVGPAAHTYHRYIVRVDASQRDRLQTGLFEEGIASEVYYPRGLHEQPALSAFKPSGPQGPLPETELATRETLALPLFPELGIDRVERVVQAVVRILKKI